MKVSESDANPVFNVDDFVAESDKVAYKIGKILDDYIKGELQKINEAYRIYQYSLAESFNFEMFMRDVHALNDEGFEPFGNGIKISFGENMSHYYIVCVKGIKNERT